MNECNIRDKFWLNNFQLNEFVLSEVSLYVSSAPISFIYLDLDFAHRDKAGDQYGN